MSEEKYNEKFFEEYEREIKHFDPDHCDICFMLFFIYSLSQGVYPIEELKNRLFKLKRDHTAQEEKIKL